MQSVVTGACPELDIGDAGCSKEEEDHEQMGKTSRKDLLMALDEGHCQDGLLTPRCGHKR